jgi:hypothetical protein
VFVNRSVGGEDYDALVEALERLDGTRIRTNVRTGGAEQFEGFGLIESFKLRRPGKTGLLLEIAVMVSDWVFRSIAAREVLTLHRDYFRLRKPIGAPRPPRANHPPGRGAKGSASVPSSGSVMEPSVATVVVGIRLRRSAGNGLPASRLLGLDGYVILR